MTISLNDNYKDLLRAIFNVDEKETKSVICVYDTKDYDKLVAIFSSSSTCGEFFNTNRRVIDSAVCRKSLRNNRFRLERVEL